MEQTMKKVLITGNSGYIGTHLTNLLKDEYEVYGLDIKSNIISVVNQYNIDIRKPFDIAEEFDAVVHLAALVNVGESEKMPISYYITNLTGTMNVVNKIKSKNFIFASTGAAQECESAYGVSKRAAEDVVREYCTQHRKQDYTIFRFYNVIGSTVAKPTNPDGLFYNLMKAPETGSFTIYGTDYPNTNDGTCVRDYVHVEEICHALREAIEKPANRIECLGHGVGYTVREMANLFQKVNNCDFDIVNGPRRKGDIEYYVLEDVSSYMKNLYTIDDLLKV
jgi:UDP-glucose 4-epimerase